MKTAEEYITPMVNIVTGSNPENFVDLIKQIQLDAMKEGMRRAGLQVKEMMPTTGNAIQRMAWGVAAKAILAASEQLTIEQL